MSTPQPSDDALQTSAGGFGTPPAGGFGAGGSPPAGGFGGPPAGGFGGPPAGGFGAGGDAPGGSGEPGRFASFYQGGAPQGGAPPPGAGKGSKLGLLLGLGCVALLFVMVAGGAAAWLVLQEQPVVEVEPAVEGAPGIGGVGWSDDDASVPVSSKDPTWGSRTAPVTMVVFTEFECPFCVKLAKTIDALKSHYGPGELRIVLKHFPLPMHEQAKPAAVAAQAVFRAGGAKAFWTFHDLAFASSGDLSAAQFDGWATQAGVDLARYREQLGPAGAKVDGDISLGKGLGVKGTPSTFVNGVFVTGARDVAHFKEIIGEQVAAAGRERAKGTRPDRMYVELCNQNHSKTAAEGTAKPAAKPTDSTTVWAIPVGADDPVRGPAHAPVTIVEFSEYQCPFCQRVQGSLEQIRREYPTDVRLVWKDNPLPFHKRAEPAAQLAREAFKQQGSAGFWKAHDLLFANQKQLDEAALFRYAGQLGLGLGAARLAITTQAHRSILETSMEQASDFDAKGTPHFFINGRRLKGAQPFENFRAIIDEEIPKAKALLASGVAPSRLYEKLTAEGKAPKGLEKVTVTAPQPGAPFKGPAAAPVVIQVFSEFQCPFCARTQTTLAEVLREHGNDVKIVFRHKPLAFHKQAQLAAEAAQEAYAQQGNRGFWAFHDKLFQNQKDGGLERPALERYAAELGLDPVKFRLALDGGTHRGYVDADGRASEAAGITGTPSFVVNGYLIKGAQPYVKFRKAIRRALSDRGGR